MGSKFRILGWSSETRLQGLSHPSGVQNSEVVAGTRVCKSKTRLSAVAEVDDVAVLDYIVLTFHLQDGFLAGSSQASQFQ